MKPLEAFDVLCNHADKHNDYIIGKLGIEALATALSPQKRKTRDDFKEFFTTNDEPETYESPEVETPYDYTWFEFNIKARALFDTVDGYTLITASESGLSMAMRTPTPENLSTIVRMSVHVEDDEIVVRKARHIFAGSDAGKYELTVEPDDIITAHLALERLAAVNQALQTI